MSSQVQLRCHSCQRVLLEYLPVPGFWLRIRCRRCGEWVEVRIPDAA